MRGRKPKVLPSGQMVAEVYDRARDPLTGQFLDQRPGHDKEEDDKEEVRYYNPMSKANFMGLPQNDDEVTRLLISKEDYIRDQMKR